MAKKATTKKKVTAKDKDVSTGLVKKSLFSVTNDFRAISHAVEREAFENDGETSEEAWDALQAAQGTVTQKLDQCCVVVDEFDSLGQRAKNHGQRFLDTAKTYFAARDRVKKMMKQQMEFSGVLRSDGENFKTWLQGIADAVEIADAEAVPDEFVTCNVSLRMTVGDAESLKVLLENASQDGALDEAFEFSSVRVIDKKAIGKVYKQMKADDVEGEIPGTALASGRTTLRIK